MSIDLDVGKTPDAISSGNIAGLAAAVTFVFSGASEGISITGTWAGTLVFEATIDNATWFSIKALDVATWNTVTSTTANGDYIVPCAEYQATRVRCSAYTSGSAAIYMFGANAMQLMWTAQQGTWIVQQGTPPWQVVGNVASSATDSGNPVKVGAVYNSTLPTFTIGQRGDLQIDSRGHLWVINSNFPVTVDTNYGTVGTSTIRTAAQIGNALGAADFNAGSTSTQTLRVIANQGLPNTVANCWPIEITDGTNIANVKTNNELKTSDIFDTSVSSSNITVGVSAVEVKIGASPIANRKGIEIFHNGSGKLYYGASGVTTSTGIQIFKNTCKYITAGPNVHIYLVSDTAGQDVRIVELA